MPIFEITGWKEGISKSGVTFLQPSESFSELEDGFVYRQILQSRLGFKQFATGAVGTYGLLSSRGFKPAETIIEDDNVGNSVNNSVQTFTLSNVPIRESYVHIKVTDSVLTQRNIYAKWNGSGWDFAGWVKTDGTNTINTTTGAVTVTFGEDGSAMPISFGGTATTGVTLTGGDPILVDYQQLLDTSVTAANDTTQSFTTADAPIVRDTVLLVGVSGSGNEPVTITHARNPLIEEDSPGDSGGGATETFYLRYKPIAKTAITIDINDNGSPKQGILTYDGTAWIPSGDLATSGNTVDEATGKIVTTWDPVLNGGDPFFVEYQVNDGASFTSFIFDEDVGVSTNTAAQSFSVALTDILRSVVTIDVDDSVLGAKQIVATWTNLGWQFSGDVDGGGTNTINETTGAVTVTFDAILTGGDTRLVDYETNGVLDNDGVNTINWATGEIELEFVNTLNAATIGLTYEFYPSTRVMGIFEHIHPDDSRELLVFDKNYMYTYNESNNALEQIPFTSSDPISAFNITGNANYVSGTTYPEADFSERFVMTGKEMEDVFFYDGNGILRFTNTTDNGNYQAFNDGSNDLTLTRAKHVFFYGERINFLVPVLSGTTYQQGWLFSAIRNVDGNGDKFNTSGSGLINFDTSDFISSFAKVADSIFLTLYKSSWVVDKSRDNFNPYIVREVSTMKGTAVDFAINAYENYGEALGKDGIIQCDLREVLRCDDKIPYFTRNDVDADSIDLTYSGLDHDNFAFLYAFRSSESNVTDDTQDQVLFHNYEEKSWAIFNERFSCFGSAEVGYELSWDQIDETQNPAWERMDDTEEVWDKIGIEPDTKKDLAGDDNGFVYLLNRDFDDYVIGIIDITKAAEAVLTIYEHSFLVGDKVRIEDVEGMTEINSDNFSNIDNDFDNFFTIVEINVGGDPSKIKINQSSLGYSDYARGGLISKVIEFSATLNEFNPWRDQGIQCYIKEIEFLIDTNGGSLRVDLYDSSSTNPWREDVLMLPTSETKEREFVKLSVENVSDFHTIRMRQFSARNQVRVTSVRINAEPAGLTND